MNKNRLRKRIRNRLQQIAFILTMSKINKQSRNKTLRDQVKNQSSKKETNKVTK